ncbi:xanthine dehydrogenase family protein subunit M [Neorhizobium sp. T7_12]|uniref:FAD binding domain-containing protein n=1 Tax=Neorhizobium sp. T7_12 TaxID=2093832 RepID=UPI000CFA3091|nr:FAD binding domain-containing protein [Neorhizobium sp. T7_12]
MQDFEFIKARTIGEAVSIAAADEDAKFLGGGQAFLPTLKQRLAGPSVLISLNAVKGMRGVTVEGDTLTIGGGTSHAVVAREVNDVFPALAKLAGGIGDPAVRNRGTIGGSLANNDPSACYPAAVLACNATIITDRREIAATDYFQGIFATALEHDEIIVAVRFKVPSSANYQKFIQPASRFALVGVFVAQYSDRVGAAITGASGDGVFRWHEAESRLVDTFDPSAVEEISVSPDGMIEDLFGTKDYRAHLISVLTARAVRAIVSVL